MGFIFGKDPRRALFSQPRWQHLRAGPGTSRIPTAACRPLLRSILHTLRHQGDLSKGEPTLPRFFPAALLPSDEMLTPPPGLGFERPPVPAPPPLLPHTPHAQPAHRQQARAGPRVLFLLPASFSCPLVKMLPSPPGPPPLRSPPSLLFHWYALTPPPPQFPWHAVSLGSICCPSCSSPRLGAPQGHGPIFSFSVCPALVDGVGSHTHLLA